MPHYDYRCPGLDCAHLTEVYHRTPPDEHHIERCPRCGRPMVRQIGAGAAVVFRGDGFYCTDYRKGTPTKEE